MRTNIEVYRERTNSTIQIVLPRPMGILELIGWLEFELPGWEPTLTKKEQEEFNL